MSKCRSFLVFMMVLAAGLGSARGQDASTPQEPATPDGTQPQSPLPAYGQDNAPASTSDNPPISGLDIPNLQPHTAPLSYLQGGAHFSESIDSNVENTLGGSKISSITDVLGSLELQRLWSHYSLGLDYVGGVGYYD